MCSCPRTTLSLVLLEGRRCARFGDCCERLQNRANPYLVSAWRPRSRQDVHRLPSHEEKPQGYYKAGPEGPRIARFCSSNAVRGHLLQQHHSCTRRSREPLDGELRSEEHTSELQSLMRISYAVFCLKKKNTKKT